MAVVITEVIVNTPSKSVDFKFDYIVPKNSERVIQIGVRAVILSGPRTIQGYVMSIQQKPDGNMDISGLGEIEEVRDIKPELTSELIQLSE